MENIQLSQLNPAGAELFMDSESFVQDLTETDAMLIQGGEGKSAPPPHHPQKDPHDIHDFLLFGIKGLALSKIESIAKTFSAQPGASEI